MFHPPFLWMGSVHAPVSTGLDLCLVELTLAVEYQPMALRFRSLQAGSSLTHIVAQSESYWPQSRSEEF